MKGADADYLNRLIDRNNAKDINLIYGIFEFNKGLWNDNMIYRLEKIIV